MAGVLLVFYPAWDAFANARDAQANGGFRANVPQALNTAVSIAVALGVLAALRIDMRLRAGAVRRLGVPRGRSCSWPPACAAGGPTEPSGRWS